MATHSPRSIHVRLAFAQFAIFVVLGIYLPFWALWLKSRGFDEGDIGFLIAGPNLFRNLLIPIVAILAERSGRHRDIAIGLAVIAILGLAASEHVSGFVGLLAILVVFYGALSTIFLIVDHLALAAGATHGVVYGRVRVFGSAGFLLANTLGGFLLQGEPPPLIHHCLLGTLIASVAALALLPKGDPPVAATTADDAGHSRRLPATALAGLALAYGLIQASHGAFYVGSSLRWKMLGFGERTVGVLWALGVFAEIAFFAFGTRVFRFGTYRWLVVGGTAAVIRWYIHPHCTTLPAFVALQLTHALTFGATHLAGLHLLREIVPRGRGTTAQAVLYTVGGVLGSASMAWSGRALERYGDRAFLHMIAFAATGLLMAIVSKPAIDRARRAAAARVSAT